MPAIDHEPTFNPDGSRLYIGGQLPRPDSNAMLGPRHDRPRSRRPQRDPGRARSLHRLHDDRRPRVPAALQRDRRHAAACVPEASPADLPGLRRPGLRARHHRRDRTGEDVGDPLADSRFDQCGPSGITGGPSTAYHDVDDPTDTTYAVIGFDSAGFRIFDVRDPANPVEVAYWNHGDSQHTKSYVIPETGHIWASDANGFWVLELEPQVREQLGLG